MARAKHKETCVWMLLDALDNTIKLLPRAANAPTLTGRPFVSLVWPSDQALVLQAIRQPGLVHAAGGKKF
ncbi:MAG: hypothetical protein SGCHY_000517, partial [Lobulomycetales sp.]